MRIKYPDLICESETELRILEQELARQRGVDRVRMLRLLKTGEAPSLRTCAARLGRSLTQVTRWWKQYQQQGLAALTTMPRRTGKQSWVSDAVWADLQQEMRARRLVRLEDARQYLKARWGIEYRSASGVWALFKQRGVKLRIGPDRRWYVDESAVVTSRRN